MQSCDMTWGYSFGKSPRLAREIDLSHPGRFYSWEKRHERCVDRAPHVTRYTHVNEMDERDAHVCDTTEIRRPLIECHFHSAHNVGTSILKLGSFYRRFRDDLYAVGPSKLHELLWIDAAECDAAIQFSFSNIDNWNVNTGTFPSQSPSEYNERSSDIVPSTVFDIELDIYCLVISLNLWKTFHVLQIFLYLFFGII